MGESARTSRVLTCETYAATQEHVAQARRLTRRVVGEHPRGDDAGLLVSELATNAVCHANAQAFTLLICETTNGGLKIAVFDDGRTDTTPHLSPCLPCESTSGRGMRLVDQIAKRWGITRERAGGLAVWFILDRQPTPVAEGSA